jgi:hypothetical protein
MGGNLGMSNSKILSIEDIKTWVGPIDSRSQNFSFLAFKGNAVGLVMRTATATARDGRKFFYRSNQVLKRENQQ